MYDNVKRATHLAILYADRGEYDRQRKSQANFATNWCGHDFFSPIAAMCHFNIVHVIKPPNLIDVLYWQFAVMSVENRGNGHTLGEFNRRYLTSQISAILYADRA